MILIGRDWSVVRGATSEKLSPNQEYYGFKAIHLQIEEKIAFLKYYLIFPRT